MQEENNTNVETETTNTGAEKNAPSLPNALSDEDTGFVEEVLIADHTDYETDWSEFDVPDTYEKPSDSDGNAVKDSAYYEREIRKLKKKREQFDNHSDRMRNKMKGELRKDRNARLVMWGAEFEYWVGRKSPSLKKLLPYLDRDTQKRIIAHIFAEIRTGPVIINILKDYTKDIKDVLPEDLKPYAE